MPKKKKKKKESWKERQRRISIKHQRALEAERIRRERAPKKKGGFFSGKKPYPNGVSEHNHYKRYYL